MNQKTNWPEDVADWPQTASAVQGGVVPAKPTHTYGKTRTANQEPFGYFRALRYWWTSCDKSDKGAVPLYSQETVNELLKHCDVLAELVAFQRDARLVALKELAIVERQRDLLLEALDRIAWNRKLNEKPSKHVEAMERIAINAIRSAKGGAA